MRAAACTPLDWISAEMGFVGLTSRAMLVTVGTSSCNTSSRFGPSSSFNEVTPVTLPPARFRLTTRPSLTGSPPVWKTIGIFEVAAFAASAECPPNSGDHGHLTMNQIGRQCGQLIFWPSAQRATGKGRIQLEAASWVDRRLSGGFSPFAILIAPELSRPLPISFAGSLRRFRKFLSRSRRSCSSRL